jgi:hypothetical protein
MVKKHIWVHDPAVVALTDLHLHHMWLGCSCLHRLLALFDHFLPPFLLGLWAFKSEYFVEIRVLLQLVLVQFDLNFVA